MEVEIKDLDNLLMPILQGREIEKLTTRNLVAPGENYGSVMVALDIKIKNSDEEINLVAKLCPPTEFIKKMFNIPITYKKEVGFYSVVIPTLQEFQKERGCEKVLDITPKYFGSRISLNPQSTEVDDDACLLLDNIKVKGFDTGNRLKGFDLEAAEMLIKDLALFHAVPIALKLVHPETFEEKIKPNLIKHQNEENCSDVITKGMINVILQAALKHPECAQHVKELEKCLLINADNVQIKENFDETIFWTINHNDCWVNNTMQKYSNGKLVKTALIDFQLLTYGNPAVDLLFFIYSSLSNKLIEDNYENLINVYFETFINTLKDLQINTDEFTYEAFKKEIDKAARFTECFHILIMMKPILLEKDKVKDLSTISLDELLETEGFSDLYYSRVWFTIMDFVNKGWL